MKDTILLKQGEIVLKGLNRSRFEQRLLSEIRRRLIGLGNFEVWARQSVVYVEPQDDGCDVDRAFDEMKKVFGIVSLTHAAACEKSAGAMAEKAAEYLRDELGAARSFKVETKRSDKLFPMTSIEISQYVGGRLADAFPNAKPQMKNPELMVHLELRETTAYVHGEPVKGAGGMPVGSNGRAVALLSGGIDSPVAMWMAARRGLKIVPVHFHSFPYTSEQAKEKVIALTDKLAGWCGPMALEIVPFTRVQEDIRKSCPEDLFTLIMRRFMMRIAAQVAERTNCSAIITGESLGQVASQTIEAMTSTQSVIQLPVIQPLIGMDKEEIVERARGLGTLSISELPYEDCCSVFTPKHPKTKPTLCELRAAEAALNVKGLVEEALGGITTVRVGRWEKPGRGIIL